jgi:hypothetical protein
LKNLERRVSVLEQRSDPEDTQQAIIGTIDGKPVDVDEAVKLLIKFSRGEQHEQES